MNKGYWVFLLLLSSCSDGVRPDGGTPCVRDEECGIGEYCLNGWCTPFGGDQGPKTCKTDQDCDPGWHCRQGICEPGAPDGSDGFDGFDAGDAADAADGADGPLPQPNIILGGDVIIRQDASGITYEINFGSVAVGVPMEANLVVRNSGDADLRLTVVTVVDDPQGEFALSPEVPPELLIPPGEERTLLITYTARDGLTDRARARLFSNDPDQGQIDVSLISEFKGTAKLTIEPSLLDFGSVPMGQQVPKTLNLINSGEGNAVLTITGLAPEVAIASAYSFSATLGGQVVVPPFYINRGDFAELTITYLANQRGRADGNFVVTSSLDSSPHTVPLRASCAVPQIEVLPPSVDFGPVELSRFGEQTVIIKNTGTGPLEIAAIEKQAGGSTEFELSLLPPPLPEQPASVSAGGETAFKVTYTPGDVGSDAGSVLIVHDAPVSGSQTVLPLAGSGFVGNQPPVAVILANGRDVSTLDAMLTDRIDLDGQLSWDDVGITGYQWQVLEQPPISVCGTPIVISGASSMTASSVMSEAGLVRLGLTVTDNAGAQGTDTLDVTVHARPTARIMVGNNGNGFAEVDLNTQLQFDARQSRDCDGSISSYQWSFLQYPAGRGSAPAIGGGGQYATVTFDYPGDYRIGLIVGDNDNPQNLSDQATFDIRVHGPKAFRLELHVYDAGQNDQRVDIDMHLLKPGSGTSDFYTENDCCPDKSGVDDCNINPNWGEFGNPIYQRDVYEDPDGLRLPNPGQPQDGLAHPNPGMGDYKLYVRFRCHSSTSFTGYICCEGDLSDPIQTCPSWLSLCRLQENKCARVGQGAVRFYVVGYDNVERWVADKEFAFPADSSGQYIQIGIIRWPQGTLQ